MRVRGRLEAYDTCNLSLENLNNIDGGEAFETGKWYFVAVVVGSPLATGGRSLFVMSGSQPGTMVTMKKNWCSYMPESEEFLQGLQALWHQSRPLQKRPKTRQGRRSRVDPLEAHADLIHQWLEAEADVGSQELLERLIALDPDRYGPQHKRTLQRRIRDWRVTRVQQCLESAAQRPETQPETRKRVLPGVNQNG